MSAPATTTGISDEVRDLANQEYRYGFVTDLDTDVAPKGLNEDIIALISAKKNEPDWLLESRLRLTFRTSRGPFDPPLVGVSASLTGVVPAGLFDAGGVRLRRLRSAPSGR